MASRMLNSGRYLSYLVNKKHIFCYLYVASIGMVLVERLEKGCRKKKSTKCTRQDRKVAWVFTEILHIGLEEMYKLYFCKWKLICIPLRRPISVALLSLSHIFELGQSFKIQRG